MRHKRGRGKASGPSTPRGGGGPRRGGFGGRGSSNRGAKSTFTPRSGQFGRNSDLHTTFSLRDEARNTEHHRGDWTTPLRTLGVTFVYSGHLDPSELLKPTAAEPPKTSDELVASLEAPCEPFAEEEEEEEETVGDDTLDKIDVGKLNLSAGESSSAQEQMPEGPQQTRSIEDPVILSPKQMDDPAPAFVLDLDGDADVDVKCKAPEVRAPSPSPSVSSTGSEKIVFVPKAKRGRSVSRVEPRESLPQARTVTTAISSTITTSSVTKVITTPVTTISAPPAPRLEPTEPPMDDNFMSIQGQSGWNGKRATPGNKRRKRQDEARRQKQEEQEAIEDYLENIAAQMHAEKSENPADDSTTDSDDDASDSDAVRRYKNDGWAEDYLADFDDLSTDEDETAGVISKVLRKRTRPSGVQYLVKRDGYDTDDATWKIAEKLDSTAGPAIAKFEEEITAQLEETSGSESSDEFEDDDSNNEDEDDEDEDDDFKLAKLLQKHEELLVRGVEDDFSELLDLSDDFFPMGRSKGRKNKRKSRQLLPDIFPDPSTGKYPSASKMAAAYDDFDVMDWERPSLPSKRRKGKGRMAELNLSDSELEAQIMSTWERDRQSKKLRKIRREELRAQGMLNKKARELGKPNLQDKYKDGMTLNQAYEEIRSFMMRDHDTLAFPPMKDRDRKLIHDLAGKFSLKSKSRGKGNQRFTTVTKTSKSTKWEGDEEGIESVLRQRKFLGRMDVGGNFKAPNKSRGGNTERHREGHVVGANAPELSATNKGRLMLEKMGYKPGMTLGADGSKGISEPVVAVIKLSRTGLG